MEETSPRGAFVPCYSFHVIVIKKEEKKDYCILLTHFLAFMGMFVAFWLLLLQREMILPFRIFFRFS